QACSDWTLTERLHLQDGAVVVWQRRRHPDFSRVIRYGDAVGAEVCQVRLDSPNSHHFSLLSDSDDAVVAAIENVDVRTAAECGIAGEIARSHLRHCRSQIHRPIEKWRCEIPFVLRRECRVGARIDYIEIER